MAARHLRPLITLLVGVVLAGGLLQPVTVLQAGTDDGDLLTCRHVSAGAPVTLIFTHSMYGGEVRERWRVVGDGLVRERIVAERAAAAEYYASDGAVEQMEDGFVVVAPPLAIEAPTVRVDQTGQHRLRFDDGGEVSLAEQVEGSAPVVIEIRQRTLMQQMLGGCGA